MGISCVGCEAIICSEINDVCEFVIDFCVEFSPKASKEDIFVVTADSFVTQNCVTLILCFSNAYFIADQFHCSNY